MPGPQTLKPRNDFVVGIDVGGTKVLVRDTLSTNLHRYPTDGFPDLPSLLDMYFAKMQAYPRRITIAMAGPRDDVTGEVKMTNSPWPPFSPQQAAQRYPSVSFETTNDMVAAAAGVLHATGIDLATLKPGTPTATGTKFVLTISTGVGGCAAVWDERTKRHVFTPCEPGHIGFQPYTKKQKEYLEHLFKKYDYPSVEHAISGKHGMENWVDHILTEFDAPALTRAIKRAEKNDRPLGAVLLEFATEGSGNDKESARVILGHMGTLVGNVLANYALAYKATGGIYLIGSVSVG
ncbi:MAG: glucokinase, partial [Patescibacteria group bacterium]